MYKNNKINNQNMTNVINGGEGTTTIEKLKAYGLIRM